MRPPRIAYLLWLQILVMVVIVVGIALLIDVRG